MRLFYKFFFTVFASAQNDEFNSEKGDLEADPNQCADWETVTQEDCNWNILISQLEDITFLDSALK